MQRKKRVDWDDDVDWPRLVRALADREQDPSEKITMKQLYQNLEDEVRLLPSLPPFEVLILLCATVPKPPRLVLAIVLLEKLD
jgi:hypothetical protein